MAAPVRLVLVHGSQLSGAQWSRYAALLGPDVDLVVPDLPAHGTRRGEEFTWEGALAVIDRGGRGRRRRRCRSCSPVTAWAATSRWPGRRSTRSGWPGLALLGASAVPAGPGAALYRAIARVEGRLGVDRMSRALDRQFDALLPDELAAVIKEAGYGFDGIPAAWAGVMGLCRPSMLAEVTAPVLLVNGQLDQLRVDARRFARGGALGPLGARRHGARRAARLPADPPERDGRRPVGAAHRSAARSGGIMTAPPTGGTCAVASLHSREHLDEPVTRVGRPVQPRRRPARRVQRAVVDGDDVPRPGAGGGVGRLDRPHVPGD